MRHLLILGIVSFSLLFNEGCTKEHDYSVNQIKYGTSFGECVGYCKKELTITEGSVIYKSAGWTTEISPIICSEMVDHDEWESLKQKIDVNAFLKLSETIGCPDCADGGAEWLEVKLANGESHKVTFEYRNEPAAIHNCIPELRERIENQLYNNDK